MDKFREICCAGGTLTFVENPRSLKLYDFLTGSYFTAIKLAATWNPKAAKAIAGRKTIYPHLEKNIQGTDKVIWIHCSSAGELEQAKPVIELLKNKFPNYKILLTLFSPSGIAAAKKYHQADIVSYLPFDTYKNAEHFMKLAHPSLVIFVKYEYWYHHIHAAAFRHIPVLLISASFRKGQAFFTWYGKFYRQILLLFRHIFVQNVSSKKLLQDAGITNASLSGDTRFDRVTDLPKTAFTSAIVEFFAKDQPVIVAGSTWPGDEKLLATYAANHPTVKIVIAPHEISKKNISRLEKLFSSSAKFSSYQQIEAGANKKDSIWEHVASQENNFMKGALGEKQVLIVDNVGMLSYLYRYATITYVGGGFTRDGIHNILEAAVYGKPVVIGPNFKKYPEAKALIDNGGAFSIADAASLTEKIYALLTDGNLLKAAGDASGAFIEANRGATEKIMNYIQENRLLTS